jgi:hypothetical protein
MRLRLKRHSDTLCEAVSGIEVEVARTSAGRLVLDFFVTGSMDDLVLPPVMARSRADELWQHTCFEAFVRAGSNDAYCEFNLSPSTQWAAYAFDGYRSGMRAAGEVAEPRIEGRSSNAGYELRAALELGALANTSVWRVGLSAVIEETNGRISYWALAHPPGRADFHHSDCFALELPAA